MKPRLVLFDLDHTLLSGDSDVLWCEFLMERGLIDRAEFAARNRDMETRYRAGTVTPQEFAGFYVSTLEGRTPADLDALRHEFLAGWIAPRIPRDAMQLVEQHRGDLMVMTTATNRFITELTAAHFGIAHLIATETEIAEGRFTGRPAGILNMREGKVARLHDWLADRAAKLDAYASLAYSDSINDRPLLEAVDEAVVVDGDEQLLAVARERNWRVLNLRR